MSDQTVIASIRDAYLAANKQSPTRIKAIDHFCEFAEDWLRDSGIIGLAQHSDGMALRFNDGKESVLFTLTTSIPDAQFFSSVNVTGAAGSVRGAAAVQDTSMGITG